MSDKSLVCVRIYFKENEFIEIAELAKILKLRPVGLKAIKKRPHGWRQETVADTKGIAKALHYLIGYYKDTEAERVLKLAQILAQEKVLREQKAKMGVV